MKYVAHGQYEYRPTVSLPFQLHGTTSSLADTTYTIDDKA